MDREIIKFQLYGDDETYYTTSEAEMQNFAEWEAKEVFTWGIALDGLPDAALPLTDNNQIFINYGK